MNLEFGMQQSDEGVENWEDLLGLYTDVLQDGWGQGESIGPAGAIGLQNGCGVVFAETGNETRGGSTGLSGADQWSRGADDVGNVVLPLKVESLEELLGKVVENQDIGGDNLQQMQSRLLVDKRPSDGLSLPRSSEDIDSLSVSRPFHLGPATPDHHSLLKNSQNSQPPHLSTEENSKKFMLPQQAETGEREHGDFVSDALSSASPDASTTEEKRNPVGGNNGEVCNETPPQKTPKRRKHRPKVVRAEKPKRTPKPVAKENKTPGGDPPTKRKYVRKKDIKGSTNQGKSCKRSLNFDLGDEVGKKSKCKEFDHNDDSNTRSEAVHQNISREQTQMFAPFVGKIPPQESQAFVATVPTASLKGRTLNAIARSLNARSTNSGAQGQVYRHSSGGFSQLLILANTRQQNMDGLRHPGLQNTPQLLWELVSNREEKQTERAYSYTAPTQPRIVCSRGSHFNQQSMTLWQDFAEMNGLRMPSAENFSEQTVSPSRSIHGQTYRPRMNVGLPYFGIEEITKLMNPTYGNNKATHHWRVDSISSGLRFQKQMEGQTNSHMLSTFSRGPKVVKRKEIAHASAGVSAKRRYIRRTPPKKMLRTDRVVQQETNVPGAREHKRIILAVDDITEGMKRLQISKGKENALVPYAGDGAVVPYEAVKKRRPRPKVNLDQETNRLWNLLMGSEGSENADNMDEDKQKKWDEERRVFRGRVDSFIARMHLVQGDRRFSKWKGSVVDSIIGVYLTQNVSDHLSSSAFMSLAAKFPVKLTNTRDTSCQNAEKTSAEYVVRVTHPDGTTCHQRMTREPVYDHKSSEHGSEEVPSGNGARITEECKVSSQTSSGSVSFQASEDIRSSSGSNSEAEDQATGSNSHRPLYLFEEAGGIAELQKNQIPEMGDSYPDKILPNDHREYEKECTSSLSSTLYDTTHGSVVEELHNKSAEALGQNPIGNRKLYADSTLDRTETKTVHASDEQSTNATARKQKGEKEKEKPIDWDSLRKHVQSTACKGGRSRDTMDTLDYEALQKADVREISSTIKERGMNNMLAARIKEFLDRLVKDHGSIDLEWLRDAQPDKVKDYLLSIHGLGLKSVECIRLLTLHHLAFPVDTNVGRIAVRLGWVPLQPLPESLQLHLLELYPMLESIQKYLWPRLCMLDQETLYELHYQLITFGKVFCTKRQPNCNACPMRGECRHFASAFASARLALPGPEEKLVVCSDVSADPSHSCGIVEKPMFLPPPEDHMGGSAGFTTINCEPIIEEPASPESSIDYTERDIEDAFYEDDPDEIPEIKLNIEEFTTNLKSFIQGNTEMQGDMSKSIIALSPRLASIPAPKLKHVSRLRTEHQVYELPDSHPLLEGVSYSPFQRETADSIQLPEGKCSATESGMCDDKTCFSFNSTREAHAQTVRGTILIPCRTAMRGSFPLNGTYFQVNEVFADDKTSKDPIHVPRSSIWNLPRRTVFFGTSVSTIFKGMSTEGIQYCFWKGFVCVRGFDQKTRAPRPLKARLHLRASKIARKMSESTR
ncbi:DNA glycosylase/AP lyase ROS1-like isoform X2 [Salvia splendens]|uniref:DNA glycosylase/AP lyase ROS1-like isoform X2 n=1 Tax=Salvia splendens TaxID=180675 RepID=UPI001C26FAF2|nr:DNA glycosylase/AP lyase ROS1-like isoform X2 [Salvia splendens]